MIPTVIDLTQPIPGAPHLSWWELTTTEHRSFLEENRSVPLVFQPAAEALAQQLETVRHIWGHPLIVHSAYRCPGLNRAIGGSKTSQHMRFEAADFHIVGVSLQEVFQKIRVAGMRFGQLILEGPDPAAGLASWVHLSLGFPYRAQERCGEALYYSTRTGKYDHV